MTILMAAVETVAPLSSASGYAGADGRRATIKMFLKPIAIRANGGQSLDRQPFLCLNRYNIRLTEMHLGRIGGYFHITTVEAFPSILADGLKAGIDLSERGTGRSDIHLLIAHPFPKDLLKNKRVDKMWGKGYTSIILLSIKKQGIDLKCARINPQGVILQREPIAPKWIDYAIKISLTNDGQTHSECLFVTDMDGQA